MQVPINLGMPEAWSEANQYLQGTPCTLIEAAKALSVQVVGSAPLLQASESNQSINQSHHAWYRAAQYRPLLQASRHSVAIKLYQN